MNGRLYDPLLHRFLAPDNYVQDPYNTQNFNRYGYVLNNPLLYTDESGEWVHIVVGAVIGGLVNLAIKAYQGKINSWADGFKAFGIGAVAGALGAATGGAAFVAAGGGAAGAGGFLAGAVGGAVGTAVASPVQSLGNHLFFGDPMITWKQYAMGIGIGGLTGGLINGGVAAFNGRSFWNGSLPQAQLTPVQPLSAGLVENKNNLELAAREQIKQIIPDNNNNSFVLKTYKEYSVQPLDGRGLQIELPRPEISSYHSSLASKTDLYHNFPKEFDQLIINQGAWSQRISDYIRYNNVGYWFEAPGVINGVQGMYQIGINQQGIVFHRFFMPY